MKNDEEMTFGGSARHNHAKKRIKKVARNFITFVQLFTYVFKHLISACGNIG